MCEFLTSNSLAKFVPRFTEKGIDGRTFTHVLCPKDFDMLCEDSDDLTTRRFLHLQEKAKDGMFFLPGFAAILDGVDDLFGKFTTEATQIISELETLSCSANSGY